MSEIHSWVRANAAEPGRCIGSDDTDQDGSAARVEFRRVGWVITIAVTSVRAVVVRDIVGASLAYVQVKPWTDACIDFICTR